MSIDHKKVSEIEKLAPVERVAGYLAAHIKLAVFGARIRKNNRPDESWSKEEEDEWDYICDEVEPWWYALSKEEKEVLEPAEMIIASITRGEWPLDII